MDLTPEQKNKLIAAADIVENGDFAVLKRLLELEDFVDRKEEEIKNLAGKNQEEISSFKESFTNEIKALVEEVRKMPGEKGDSYVLTEEDKKEIAKSIPIPVLEKVLEKTVIREVPTITEVSVDEESIVSKIELDLPKLGKPVRDGLELLKGTERLNVSAIEGLDERDGKMSDAVLNRAIGIVDQRTSYLVQKVSNLSDKVAAIGTGGGASTFTALTDAPSSYTSQGTKFVRVNAGETALEFATISGGGDALTSAPLSQFAATTSLQLKGVISDETGSGALVFADTPTLVTPAIGEATGTGLTLSGLTASEMVITNGSKKLVSAAVATYPSLTELTYVKGVTSALQTQIDGKQASDADLTTIASLTATSDNIIQSASSAWASRTPAQVTATLPVFVPDTGSGGAKGLAPATAAGDATKFLRGDGTWAAIPGGGDALVANPLSQFAATTSLQLKGVISDETGSGALVFADTPTLVAPILGTPTSGTLTNCTGLPLAGVVDSTTEALGVGSLELGHASDTTLTRVSAGVVAIEGVNIETTTTTANNKIRSVGWSVDGGGSAITTGQKGGYPVVPFAGAITGYKITADTGTCTVKFWKIASGTAIPTVSNNINTSGVSLSSGTAIISSTTSDFTSTTVTANDIFALNITAISGVTKLFVELQITAS